MKKTKKIVAVILCALFLTLTFACGKGEPGPIIDNNKSEFDELINEANKPSADKISAEEIQKTEEREYIDVIENAYGEVLVNINADVEIPEAQKFSVYSVKQKPFTQEFADKVRVALFDDRQVYDGMSISALYDIDSHKKSIDETGSNSLKDVYRGYINDIISGFSLSDNNLSVSSFVTDGKLKKVADLYQNNSYYKRENGLYGDGELLRITTDGSDGTYAFMEVRNSLGYSNKLEFSSNKFYYNKLMNNYIPVDKLKTIYSDHDTVLNDKSNKETPAEFNDTVYTGGNVKRAYVPLPNETCELSEDEAIKIAEDFLVEIGVTDFKCFESKKAKKEMFGSADITFYRYAYELMFLRTLDGVFLTQAVGTKNNLAFNGPDSADYVGKRHWYGESITITVNDDGVVDFIYLSPLEITETVTENVKIKNINEVKELFRSIISSRKGNYSVKEITHISLGYSRISEGTTNYESGIIVPMWGFYGPNGAVYAINAIDGTIIDPMLGYY